MRRHGRIRGTVGASAPQEYVYDEQQLVLRCPWHGYEFSLRDGRAVYDPEDLRVTLFNVAIEDGQVVLYV